MNLSVLRKRSRLSVATAAVVFVIASLSATSAQAHTRDVNHDGIPDRWEMQMHLSLSVNQAKRDQDGDGVTNIWEFRLHLNARSGDTNHDGVSDGQEDADADGVPNSEEAPLGDNPVKADSDGNGVIDGAEDADGAGTDNAVEIENGTNPVDAGDDADGQTVADDSGASSDAACSCEDYSGFVLSSDGKSMTFESWGGGIFTVAISASIETETWGADGSYTHTTSSMQLFMPGTVLHDLQVAHGAADRVAVNAI